jgi:SOS response regulatory protein OraA/RecX
LSVRSAREWVTAWQSRRSHTAAELRRKLEAKAFSTTEIEDALSWAARYAGQSDAAVAERAADARKAQRFGQARIVAELEARGIPEAAAARAVHTTRDDEQQRAEAALAAAASRFAGEAEKAAAWLARRGFDEDVVRRAVEKLIGPLD